MRHITRLSLPVKVQSDLDGEQETVNRKSHEQTLLLDSHWKLARKRRLIDQEILPVLKRMSGVPQRCMYCSDSHGTDIEHFWPKATYPERMFVWGNLLLCCTPCGRHKGNRFPLEAGKPMLIDPTIHDPWDFLDFDPATGNLTPRFSIELNGWEPKGDETVKILCLDQREAVAAGYQRTYQRLSLIMERFLADRRDGDSLIERLLEADDHGLLGWFIRGNGQSESLSRRLKDEVPSKSAELQNQVR